MLACHQTHHIPTDYNIPVHKKSLKFDFLPHTLRLLTVRLLLGQFDY